MLTAPAMWTKGQCGLPLSLPIQLLRLGTLKLSRIQLDDIAFFVHPAGLGRQVTRHPQPFLAFLSIRNRLVIPIYVPVQGPLPLWQTKGHPLSAPLIAELESVVIILVVLPIYGWESIR